MFAICKDVVVKTIGGESVILNLSTGVFYGLDELGSRILELLSCGIPVAELKKLLLEEYDVEESQLERDLEQFCHELLERGLIAHKG